MDAIGTEKESQTRDGYGQSVALGAANTGSSKHNDHNL